MTTLSDIREAVRLADEGRLDEIALREQARRLRRIAVAVLTRCEMTLPDPPDAYQSGYNTALYKIQEAVLRAYEHDDAE